MSKVIKSVLIDSNANRIIEYIGDVSNHPAFIGPLKAVMHISGDSKKPGTTWEWTFVMAGVEFSGKAETVKYERGKSFVYKTTSGIESMFSYKCQASNGRTKLEVEVSYDVPKSLLARLQGAVVEKLNDAEAARGVENLKTILDE